MNIMELGSDAVGIGIYKLLDSMLHPAGAFPTIRTAFLTILRFILTHFCDFIEYLSTYTPRVSNVRPAGAFSLVKMAPLEISSMDLLQNQSFFSKG